MATYLIGYDLMTKEEGAYESLETAIKELGTWWHHLDSTWVVVSDLGAAGIRDKLKPHIEE